MTSVKSRILLALPVLHFDLRLLRLNFADSISDFRKLLVGVLGGITSYL